MRLFIPLCLALQLAACMSGSPDTSPPPAPTRVAAAGMTRVHPDRPGAQIERRRIIARDGAALPLRTWLPAGEPSAVVLALHGFNDYSNAFAATGEAFAARGIATYAYDQRGFGEAPIRGHWAGTERLVDDAVTATGLLRQRYPGVPLYVVGESMGGAVAALAAIRMGDAAVAPDGIVLMAPAVWGRSTMNVFERAGLWFAELMPDVRWSPALIPMRIRASDNVAMLRALGADPLVIKATRSEALGGLVDLMGAALAAAPHLRARALILYGERDEIVPRPPVEQFVAALPRDEAGRQRVALYPNGYHLLTRDLEGPTVVEDVLSWIANRGEAPLPSGADIGARARLAGAPSPPETAGHGNQATTGKAPAWQRTPS